MFEPAVICSNNDNVQPVLSLWDIHSFLRWYAELFCELLYNSGPVGEEVLRFLA